MFRKVFHLQETKQLLHFLKKNIDCSGKESTHYFFEKHLIFGKLIILLHLIEKQIMFKKLINV